jgi:hypothetical protein
VSRWTPSRWLISANPTGSCFLCWSAIEQLGQVVVPEQSERAAAHVMQVTRLGVPGGTSSGGSPQTRRRCSGEKPCSKIRRTVPWSAGMRARRPPADGDASASPTRDIAAPAVRVRHWRPAQRECGSHLTGGPSTRWLADIRGARDGPPGPPHRGTVECAAYPNRLRVIRRGQSPRRPYVVGRHLHRLDRVVGGPRW